MSSSGAIKVLLLGPQKSGKTTLSNFLSDAKEAIGQYRTTVACRIVEFQLETSYSNANKQTARNNNSNTDVQLWDCGGDPKFQSCLPALASDAIAVLLVYDPSEEDHVTQLEELYNLWNTYIELSPARYLVVARKWGDKELNKNRRTIKMGTLARLQRTEWDIDGQGSKVQSEFHSFINSALMEEQRTREQQEITILDE